MPAHAHTDIHMLDTLDSLWHSSGHMNMNIFIPVSILLSSSLLFPADCSAYSGTWKTVESRAHIHVYFYNYAHMGTLIYMFMWWDLFCTHIHAFCFPRWMADISSSDSLWLPDLFWLSDSQDIAPFRTGALYSSSSVTRRSFMCPLLHSHLHIVFVISIPLSVLVLCLPHLCVHPFLKLQDIWYMRKSQECCWPQSFTLEN